MDAISPSLWKTFDSSYQPTLIRSKIFFAHMSVGYNILQGVQTVLEQHSIQLPIVETDDPAQMSQPGLYHACLGFNGDPVAKIRSFESQLAKIAPAHPDIVLMKLCYVDIKRGQNIHDLFAAYHQSVEQLEKQYRGIRFIHCTVPLTSEPLSWKLKFKSTVKSLFGVSPWIQDNSVRMEFNDLIRDQYSPECIFDLAMVESITPEKHLCFVRSGQTQVPVLYRGYTDDGGHLNRSGSRHASELFLGILAGSPDRSSD